MFYFFFSSRRRHTRWNCDWSSDVCSSDLAPGDPAGGEHDEAGDGGQDEAEAGAHEQRLPAGPAEQQAEQAGELDVAAAKLAAAEQAEQQVGGTECEPAEQRAGEVLPGTGDR